MTKQELQARIEKKEKDISKIEKRIAKWTNGMNDEAKELCAACELTYEDPKRSQARAAWNQYNKDHSKDPTVYRQDWENNKGPNFDEAYRAYTDLAEQKATLQKYKIALDKLSNFENEKKIAVIWEFLQNWRKEAYDYFVDNVKLYYKLKSEEDQKWEEYKQTDEFKKALELGKQYRASWSAEYKLKNQWEEKYYRYIENTTKNIYLYKGTYDDAKLNKILDQEIKAKYTNLVNQVTAKAGEIVDASGLSIDQKGNIAGFIEGTKANVALWTTFVEGEIQCPHYRSYVSVR